eukprot:14408049-Ditylum_brightwellii.AAC.1
MEGRPCKVPSDAQITMCVKTCKYISATGLSEQKGTKSKSNPTTFTGTLQQGEADETWATSD